MFGLGDIVECYSAVAGYPKYHLCVLECVGTAAGIFLYINSGAGYAGDFVVTDAEIPCLPRSQTGQSVISCAQPVRLSQKQLSLFKAKKVGHLTAAVARKLEPFVTDATTLTSGDRKIILAALAKIV